MNVKLISNGAAAGTLVLDESGAAIEGITGVRVSVKAGDICRMELDLIPREIKVEGVAKTFVRGRQISRIVYADGGEEEF